MANLKPGDSDSSLWQGYSLQAPLPVNPQTHPTTYETGFQSDVSALPYYGRRPKGSYGALDTPSEQTRPPFLDGSGSLSTSPPSLITHHSIPSLKRAFHSIDDSSYGELVQDTKEGPSDLAKRSINQDHRLLSFCRILEKHNIVDNNGRIHQIDLAAQIHGMFFLSEMSSSGGDGMLVQPELTCYRRNLFQISGTVTTPRGSLSVITERGERILIMSLEVSVSASESVDGNPVKLIVIPWKTPPPNTPEVGQGQEHEPVPIPLVPFDDGDIEANNELSVYPIAYRRLQFRIATANNGRRRELQQHFTLHLNLIAVLSSGARTTICETATAPIVVRGRSPRNFQARKEIPLVGSSSSRGGLPELHVSTNIGPAMTSIATPAGNSKGAKPPTLELPRSPFTFSSNQHLPSSPSLLRTSTYPSYLGTYQNKQSNISSTPTNPAPPMELEYLQVNHSNPDLSHSQLQTTTIPGRQSGARQYTFPPPTVSPAASPLQFIDGNPRPTKSPRHITHPELMSNVPYTDYGTRFAHPYPISNESSLQREPGYNAAALPMQAWTAAPQTMSVYGKVLQAPSSNLQHYAFPSEDYVKEEIQAQQNYTWNPA